jgi:hypothetical protein
VPCRCRVVLPQPRPKKQATFTAPLLHTRPFLRAPTTFFPKFCDEFIFSYLSLLYTTIPTCAACPHGLSMRPHGASLQAAGVTVHRVWQQPGERVPAYVA